MGQATLDLPDPLNVAPLGNAPNADELLSQLAGDQIDRMLADNDVEREISDAPIASLSPAPSEDTDTESDPATQVARQAHAIPPAGERDIDTELDALFQDVRSAQAAEAPLPTAPTSPLPHDNIPTVPVVNRESEAPPPSTLAANDDLHALAERAALTAPLPENEADPLLKTSVTTPDDEDESEENSPHVPLLLLPLEWFNAPFAHLPTAVRDMLGKIGLLTLFNAAAVLIYLLLFRRHH